MSTETRILQKLVIIAADEGRIPIPKSDKSGVRTIRIALAKMKRTGLVHREQGAHPDSLVYVLTESGKNIREILMSGGYYL